MLEFVRRSHRLVDIVAGLPGIKSFVRWEYDRAFAANRNANMFRGVFDTFDAAENSAPKTLPMGYDNAAAAGMYLDRTRRIYPSDYPLIFWLQKLFAEGCTRIFDVGGHIGIGYYGYRRYLTYPATLSWVVHDVPAVMQEGRRLAAVKDTYRGLTFSERFEETANADILFASGSLQYLPEPLWQMVAALKTKPRHVLLNLTPLHARESFFTLQSIGTAFCPYRVSSVGELLQGFESSGYKLIDQWDNPEKKCEIPFHENHSLDRYHGFLFSRTD